MIRIQETPNTGMDVPLCAQSTSTCAFHDNHENDNRLTLTIAHVLDLVGDGSKVEELGDDIAGLYGYKGHLTVATRKKLSKYVETLFCRAWATCSGEMEQQVEFLDWLPEPGGFPLALLLEYQPTP